MSLYENIARLKHESQEIHKSLKEAKDIRIKSSLRTREQNERMKEEQMKQNKTPEVLDLSCLERDLLQKWAKEYAETTVPKMLYGGEIPKFFYTKEDDEFKTYVLGRLHQREQISSAPEEKPGKLVDPSKREIGAAIAYYSADEFLNTPIRDLTNTTLVYLTKDQLDAVKAAVLAVSKHIVNIYPNYYKDRGVNTEATSSVVYAYAAVFGISNPSINDIFSLYKRP